MDSLAALLMPKLCTKESLQSHSAFIFMADLVDSLVQDCFADFSVSTESSRFMLHHTPLVITKFVNQFSSHYTVYYWASIQNKERVNK